ncbi:MAG: ABC transporter permease [Chloroflexota bacterium]|nr:ABC transporter permease [Chloroflexota bacterium]
MATLGEKIDPKSGSRSGRAFLLKLRRLAPLLSLVALLLLWQLITSAEIYPAFIVPPPAAVGRALIEALQSGLLLKHLAVTLEEMFLGLILGLGIGLSIGYAIAKAPILEYTLSPVIVAFQSTPIVAYAPLLVIWFGSGPTSKIVTTAVIVFFPSLVNIIVAVRAVSPNLRDLMRSLNATPWQTFRQLELPSALPVVLAGLKTSATLAVIGAVVGEFVTQGSGLGYLVTSARNQYDTPLVIVTVLTMTAIALSLYSFVVLLEWRWLAWRRRSKG